MKNSGIFLIAAVVVASASFASPAFSYPGQALSRHAKVTMAHARRIALKAYPGKITSAELEKERGGSGLRFSFDVLGKAGLREIGVDARTGKVLENSKEGPNAD